LKQIKNVVSCTYVSALF